ncbi:glutathionylspermidine synthase family protein [Alsobacter sp. KACC 23698]|uniref:Glutathionylspermidine synthase family protein n=1 Tax=Alsobacter sp. KACC 23698 TaxID=3149229 RepID=A0AAU7JM90_9HYPH
MRRIRSWERPDWRALAEQEGFVFHTAPDAPYWTETVCYGFTLREIEDDLEAPSGELHAMCLELVARVVRDERSLRRLRIPEWAWPLIADSWSRADPSLYGRFDLAYDARSPAKLLEYNADTPTSAYETACFQWRWLEDLLAAGKLPHGSDQFNALHDRLIARWPSVSGGGLLHFACMSAVEEDVATVEYLRNCAAQAGVQTSFVGIEQIGLTDDGAFVDMQDRRIARLFKLYPWEWLLAEPFGLRLSGSGLRMVEPPWKAILSNKGMLALLWEMFPNHPNLLPCWFDDEAPPSVVSYARKPLFSREGANVTLVERGKTLAREDGPYGADGFVRQALAGTRFNRVHVVLGSWIVGDEPAGLSVRESDEPVTRDTARFVPHYIEP